MDGGCWNRTGMVDNDHGVCPGMQVLWLRPVRLPAFSLSNNFDEALFTGNMTGGEAISSCMIFFAVCAVHCTASPRPLHIIYDPHDNDPVFCFLPYYE